VPSGVIAKPSIPLLATRPVVLVGLPSEAVVGPWIATARLLGSAGSAGSGNVLLRCPVARSNWYTYGPHSSEMKTLLRSLATSTPSGSRRALFGLVDGPAPKLSERPVK